jgi:hypothetical protein
MEISIFGFKFRLEILILIVVVYLILTSHLLCSCSRFPLMETFTGISPEKAEKESKKVIEKLTNPKKRKTQEGFYGSMLINDGESSSYKLGSYNGVIMPTSTWGSPDLVVTPGKPLGKGVEDILNREKQPVPLPEGELNIFETTPFKPECCPNTYSNSDGCACMTVDQYNYLITRGGNNVPYSEY